MEHRVGRRARRSCFALRLQGVTVSHCVFAFEVRQMLHSVLYIFALCLCIAYSLIHRGVCKLLYIMRSIHEMPFMVVVVAW